MSLYDPERHLPADRDWDPEQARAWLRKWAEATLAVWAAQRGWPQHPRDAADSGDITGPLHSLYCGSAGVWLALARLAAADLCRLPRGLADIYSDVLDGYARTPDTGQCVPSWFLGESGLLVARFLARPDPAPAERLVEVIRANRDNPTREVLWGAPGTMIAALFLYERTAEARWAELFRDSAQVLWESWFFDEERQVWLWEQDLYGQKSRYLGAGHGWAGNLYPLWRGQALLSATQRDQLRTRTRLGLERLALVEGDLANWPPQAEKRDKLLVQWCHGAPGLIMSLRHAELPEALPLLTKGGNLIVRAGLLEKGAALCHGSDGNGMALLELYRRTGDPAWLAQARRFAMGALAQSAAGFAKYGQWRPSLWTGDAGLACYVLDCLRGASSGMPGLDSFW